MRLALQVYIYTRETPAFGGISLALRGRGAAIGAPEAVKGGGKRKSEKKIRAPRAPQSGW